jgi:integrase
MPRNAVASTSKSLLVPSYRLHKPSGRAVDTLSGQDHYLGRYGTAESRSLYEARVAEWIAGGRQPNRASSAALTVAQLVLAYWNWLQPQYPERTLASTVKPALRRLTRLYGPARAAEFGPSSLKAYRQALIEERSPAGRRLSRPYINRCVRQVRRAFRWGVGEELVPPGVLHALEAVDPIRFGRCDAPEPRPVGPVPEVVIDATCEHLTSVVADMARLQRITGMRPGEICAMCMRDISMEDDVWIFTPTHHKTLHRGKRRDVPLGPWAQAILKKHTRPELDLPLFSPVESELARKQRLARTASPGSLPLSKSATPVEPKRRTGSSTAGTPPAHTRRQSAGRALQPAFRSGGLTAYDTPKPRSCGESTASTRPARCSGTPSSRPRRSTPSVRWRWQDRSRCRPVENLCTAWRIRRFLQQVRAEGRTEHDEKMAIQPAETRRHAAAPRPWDPSAWAAVPADGPGLRHRILDRVVRPPCARARWSA